MSITVYRKGHSEKSTTTHRSSANTPVDIFYDKESRVIYVSAEDESVTQISLKDTMGNLLGYSSSVDAVFEVPMSYQGLLYVYVDSANWIVVAEINPE